MNRGDMVKIDGGKNCFFALHDINTWENIKGAFVRSEDVCLVLRSRSTKWIGKSWNEKLIQILTPRGQIGWLSNQYMKVVGDES